MGDNLYSCPAMLLRKKHIVLLKGAAALTVQSTHNYTVVIFFFRQSVAPGFHHDVFLCTFLRVSQRAMKTARKKKFKGKKNHQSSVFTAAVEVVFMTFLKVRKCASWEMETHFAK